MIFQYGSKTIKIQSLLIGFVAILKIISYFLQLRHRLKAKDGATFI